MLLRFVVFLAVFLSIFGGAHALVGGRVGSLLGLAGWWRVAWWTSVVLLGCSTIVAQFAARGHGPSGWGGDLVIRIGFLWLGFVLLLFVGAVAGECVALLVRLVPGSGPNWGVWIRGAFLVLAFAGGLVGVVGGMLPPRIHEVTLHLKGLPPAFDGYRVAHLTDTHVGPILRRVWSARLVERINAWHPDLVAMTGDLVDGPVERVASETAPFAGLRARDGVVFVTGNHDYYSGGEPWREVVRGYGWSVLDLDRRVVERGGERLVVLGLPDPHEFGRSASSFPSDLPDGFRLLLAHRPSQARDAVGMGVGLQLSGHTHGGQVWPFHGFVKLAEPVVSGLGMVGDVPVFVANGAGFWGPPMRLFARSEVPILVLRRG